jgi:CheY-like chemotaxis protein
MDPVVLIVDDNDDNRFTLSMRLEACGYENRTARVAGAADRDGRGIAGHQFLAR